MGHFGLSLARRAFLLVLVSRVNISVFCAKWSFRRGFPFALREGACVSCEYWCRFYALEPVGCAQRGIESEKHVAEREIKERGRE